MPTRSVARADVAELAAVLEASVEEEPDHHLVVVVAKDQLSSTQFKQMFYSRGDDFFQIANCYACPDSAESIKSSVWGIDASFTSFLPESHQALNFNKLGGRHNDPSGVQMAYGYAADPSRTFFAQHEVMGYLEQDTCVKRDNWTACSRMSIEDQLYSLAFASETDQDLCLKVTCARRWSEVEDALAESCLAASSTGNSNPGKIDNGELVDLYINVRVTNGHPKALDTIIRVQFNVKMGSDHDPSDLHSWNTRASTAASGVIQAGVEGDAPEGGEDPQDGAYVAP